MPRTEKSSSTPKASQRSKRTVQPPPPSNSHGVRAIVEEKRHMATRRTGSMFAVDGPIKSSGAPASASSIAGAATTDASPQRKNRPYHFDNRNRLRSGQSNDLEIAHRNGLVQRKKLYEFDAGDSDTFLDKKIRLVRKEKQQKQKPTAPSTLAKDARPEGTSSKSSEQSSSSSDAQGGSPSDEDEAEASASSNTNTTESEAALNFALLSAKDDANGKQPARRSRVAGASKKQQPYPSAASSVGAASSQFSSYNSSDSEHQALTPVETRPSRQKGPTLRPTTDASRISSSEGEDDFEEDFDEEWAALERQKYEKRKADRNRSKIHSGHTEKGKRRSRGITDVNDDKNSSDEEYTPKKKKKKKKRARTAGSARVTTSDQQVTASPERSDDNDLTAKKRFEPGARHMRYVVGGNGMARQPWTQEEENCLMMALQAIYGHKEKELRRYHEVLARHGPTGTIDNILARRNNMQLKDKARNVAEKYMRLDRELPEWMLPLLYQKPKRDGTDGGPPSATE